MYIKRSKDTKICLGKSIIDFCYRQDKEGTDCIQEDNKEICKIFPRIITLHHLCNYISFPIFAHKS